MGKPGYVCPWVHRSLEIIVDLVQGSVEDELAENNVTSVIGSSTIEARKSARTNPNGYLSFVGVYFESNLLYFLLRT